mmetsp:Transcript_34382/g.50345  ORF Transcript_34382/g.50345 Transcript_34382/m.50345 type:complete len:124 (+) Transcript_34382:1040-1411(+)
MLKTEFLTSYTVLHNIETMPLYPTYMVPDKSSMSGQAIVPTVNPNNTILFRHVQNIYVFSWDKFIEQHNKNAIGLDLKQLQDKTFETKKHKDVANILESETSVDKDTLTTNERNERGGETRDE